MNRATRTDLHCPAVLLTLGVTLRVLVLVGLLIPLVLLDFATIGLFEGRSDLIDQLGFDRGRHFGDLTHHFEQEFQVLLSP